MRLTRRLLPALAAAPAFAQSNAPADWPSRPVTVVVPWPAGGSTDSLVRVITQHLAGATGQSFVVENRTGATGTVAVHCFLRSAS